MEDIREPLRRRRSVACTGITGICGDRGTFNGGLEFHKSRFVGRAVSASGLHPPHGPAAAQAYRLVNECYTHPCTRLVGLGVFGILQPVDRPHAALPATAFLSPYCPPAQPGTRRTSRTSTWLGIPVIP